MPWQSYDAVEEEVGQGHEEGAKATGTHAGGSVPVAAAGA